MLREPQNSRKPTQRAPALRGRVRTEREEFPSPVILVVERDQLLRWALFEILADAGFRVLTAPDGPAALALIGQIDQDVALALVDDDTWPMTASVRAALQKRWPGLPFVVTLAMADPLVDARAREHGAAAVLIKPFDLNEVVREAQKLTARAHATPSPAA